MSIKSEIEVRESIYINVPKEELWKITALDFGNVYKWISGVNSSRGSGKGINGSVCLERTCKPTYKGFSETKERIIEYVPEEFKFTYQIVKGLPKMVSYATNEWTHTSKNKGTSMNMHTIIRLNGIMGFLMKGMMEKKMTKIIREALEELKDYAETGQLHPRKLAANEKYKQAG